MSGLIQVWDAAYMGDLSTVPESVVAIAGYVGGPGASHVWPTSDAAKVLASGRQFWSIWVPPQGRALKAQDGIDAARGMIQAIPRYISDRSRPCFMDIEYNQYYMDVTGAGLAASTFQATMKGAGYYQPYPYAPYAMGRGWVAEYVYSKPVTLPHGTIGWQYENDAYSHKGWDASVFDASLYNIPSVQGVDDMQAEDWTHLQNMLNRAVDEIRTETSEGNSIANVMSHLEAQGNKLSALQDDINAIKSSLANQ